MKPHLEPRRAVFQHSSYRPYLRSVLADRISRNPAYSLRSMASHLGMAPSSFSEVLKGRTGLSLQAAARIARKLGLSEDESEYFALLV
ncbi:MAG: TIGR02147 family protein, partial [Bdellovibrionota bacterium]